MAILDLATESVHAEAAEEAGADPYPSHVWGGDPFVKKITNFQGGGGGCLL